MKESPQQQANREVLVAREFLKAACSQPVGEGESCRPPLAGRFDFLSRYHGQQPGLDNPLALISRQWVPVGTRLPPPADSGTKPEKAPPQNTSPSLPASSNPADADQVSTAKNQAVPTSQAPPAPSGQQASLQGDADKVARRGRKRERPTNEVVVDPRWTLKQKLAALTQDIELLTQEIAAVRDEADASCSAPRLTLEEKAAIAEKHAKKQADAQKRGMSVMLRDIMGHKFANPFLKPVDTKLYPDYPSKISKPLDFGTVKARLDAGNYTGNMEAFVQDMGQIYENAFIYNAPGSTVHGWAATLKEKFEERFKSLTARLAAMEGEQQKEEEDILDVAKRRLQDKAWEALAAERPRFEPLISSLESRIKEFKAEAAAKCFFMPQPEKHALMEALSELKTEDFEQGMQIILHRHPGLLQANAEVLNIDVDPLDALTLRQLAAFCHFCLKGTKPEFSSAWPGLLFGAGARGLQSPNLTLQSHLAETAPNQGTNEQPKALRPNSAARPVQEGPLVAKQRTDRDKVPELKPISVQKREIGERSWSVLDTQAVTELKAGLREAAAQEVLDHKIESQRPDLQDSTMTAALHDSSQMPKAEHTKANLQEK